MWTKIKVGDRVRVVVDTFSNISPIGSEWTVHEVRCVLGLPKTRLVLGDEGVLLEGLGFEIDEDEVELVEPTRKASGSLTLFPRSTQGIAFAMAVAVSLCASISRDVPFVVSLVVVALTVAYLGYLIVFCGPQDERKV